MRLISCTTATALAVFTFASFLQAEEKSPEQAITGTASAKAVPEPAGPGILTTKGNVVVGVTKDGAGTLTLSGANTYTGTTTVSAGTFTGGAPDLVAGSPATVGGHTLTTVGAGTVTLTGANTDTGGVTIGSGTITAGVVPVENGFGAAGSGTLTLTASAALEAGPVTWLGLATDALSGPLAAQLPIDKGTGLLISHVVPESPAQHAGLEVNDVLQKFDDQLLINPEQLRALVRTKKAGDSVKLSYFRKGEPKEATVSFISKELTKAEGNGPAVLEFQSSALLADELIKGLKNGGAPMIIERKTFVVGPDGQLTVQDSNSAGAPTGEQVTKALEQALEAVKKSGASEEVVKSMEKALQDSVNKSKAKSAAEPKAN